MSSRLLVICQKVDENDDLLGFFVSWIREFASHYDRVTVITMAKGEYTLPVNVRVVSLGKEEHLPKWRQAFRFIHVLWREVRAHDAVFTHMSPIFAIAAWPYTFIWHKKLVLWYLHRSRTLKLRFALALVDTLVTADSESLTIRSPKIVAVGHGIDIARFAVPDRMPPAERPSHILSVGRLSPIKGFETLIHAVERLRKNGVICEVRIVGKAVMPNDQKYEEQLRALVARLGVGDVMHFFGFVPYRDVPSHYRWADVVVGCTPPGGIDKAILEGMAAACAVVTSNAVMRKYFVPAYADEYIFRYGDPMELADKLERIFAADLRSIGTDMQRVVARDHNLPITIRKIISLL